MMVVWTGCQWAALDEMNLGVSSSTAHRRYQEWVAAGVFDEFWQRALRYYDANVGVDWRWLSVDGRMGKAPLGGEATGRSPVDRGKLGTKTSHVTDGRGVPLGVVVAGANRHDVKLFAPTIQGVRLAPSVPLSWIHFCLDKGYDSDDIRAAIELAGMNHHIRCRGEEIAALRDGESPRRWVVERTFSWYSRWRGLLIRWSKRAANHLAFLHVAAAVVAWRAAGMMS
jgi:putative transposase